MEHFLILFLILFPMLGALGVLFLDGERNTGDIRDWTIRIVPAVETVCAAALLFRQDAAAVLPGVCGLGLTFAADGGLRMLLVLLTVVLWMGSALSCPAYFKGEDHCKRFYFFWLLTLGALMGVFLAGDLFTLFVFFEMMSLASCVWVAQTETETALAAARTYLTISVIGGMAMLSGLFLLNDLLGTLTFGAMRAAVEALAGAKTTELYVAGGLCLAGFGAKAGMFPLHVWLPKAYPAAPAPATALLSGILSKGGVFGVLILCRELFWTDLGWNRVVLALAVATMVLGAVLALFSTDLKRTLACSSMSQIGFILVGAAMQGFLDGENAMASLGTILHLTNHSLIKMVLFLAAGVIFMNTRTLDLNEIRGWGRNKPWLKAVFLIAAASVAGVPGLSGYVSKTLLHESIVEYIHVLAASGASVAVFKTVEWLFLISGGLTAAYMTKLFIAVFVSHGAEEPSAQRYVPRGLQGILTLVALSLVVMGLMPGATMEPMAQWAGAFLRADALAHSVHYFAWVNLKGALISLTIGALVYGFIVRKFLMAQEKGETVYLDRWPEKLDLEALVYRPVGLAVAFFGAFCARVLASLGDWVIALAQWLLFFRAPGIFWAKRDEDFGDYKRKPERSQVGESFSFDLLLAVCGVLAMLVYVLLRAG